MATGGGISYRPSGGSRVKLDMIDTVPHGDERVGAAIHEYASVVNQDRKSAHWARAVRWMENFFFSNGRHYINDIVISRIANSSSSGIGDLSVIREARANIPKPTNDILGPYISTNVALYTENRPRPRVSPKSDKDEDQTSAELSELTIEYLWEALGMPEKHREIARLFMHCGIAFMEIAWDPTIPRRMQVPQTREEKAVVFPEGSEPTAMVVPRQVPVLDEQGNPVMTEEIQYGDIAANVISPFQMHLPDVHYWNGTSMNWTIKEEFTPISALRDKYGKLPKRGEFALTKDKGWNLDAIENVTEENITELSMWWWERIATLVEGPGPSLYLGAPDTWEGYAVVRTFDRAPCATWPKGRTVITLGRHVLYDSPKDVGGRSYDPRWPSRWHPYVRYRWEAMAGSIYGRSMISKMLPYIKRINSIDTTGIMWRRTAPISMWIAPKGSHVREDSWGGTPGHVYTFDPRRTATHKPEPVYPPPLPPALEQEKQFCLGMLEKIAGTEQILRGERPIGVNSAAMIDILRKQALASRSASLQEWDESLQEEGTLLLQVTAKNVKNDARYAERIRVLAREKHSRLSIDNFSGTDLSDNVVVRVDTVSLALVSKEAREAKMIEVLQYLPAIMAVPDIGLRQAILEELSLKKAIMPSGPDVNRAKKMISLIKNNRAEYVYMLPEDDPHIFHAILVNEVKEDGFIDLPKDQQTALIGLMNMYKRQIQLLEMQQMQQMQNQMAMAAMMGQKPGGNG